MPVVSGLSAPVAIADAGDGSNRLFVVQQAGRVRLIKSGILQGTPFLDISTKVSCCGERGLLGLAFPPGYAAKGHFYVYYTDPADAITVARYRVGANPDGADPASEQVLLSVAHTRTNHNGGQLAFGPGDGYLYIALGDGGGGGFGLDVVQEDRGQDHAWNAHQPLADDQGDCVVYWKTFLGTAEGESLCRHNRSA